MLVEFYCQWFITVLYFLLTNRMNNYQIIIGRSTFWRVFWVNSDQCNPYRSHLSCICMVGCWCECYNKLATDRKLLRIFRNKISSRSARQLEKSDRKSYPGGKWLSNKLYYRWCLKRSDELLNFFSQYEHWKGFSPVWVRTWIFKFSWREKRFPHSLHSCGFSLKTLLRGSVTHFGSIEFASCFETLACWFLKVFNKCECNVNM